MMFILLSGFPPFNGETDEIIISKVKKGQFAFSQKVWQTISDDAKDLVTKMLTFDPEKRISAQEALDHQWFKKEQTDQVVDSDQMKSTIQ